MRTLADFKRALTLGSSWQTYHVLNGCVDMGIRTVGKVQSNGVWFKSPAKEKMSWLDFPAASEIECNGDEARVFWPASEYAPRRHVLTYKKVEA